jgi:predicted acetyltransferase
MKITIRPIQGEEMFDTLYTLNSYSLYPSPPFQNREQWEAITRDRQGITCHTLFEDNTPVSIVVNTPLTQNMRGKLFPASGIWGVSTVPADRRKGYCKQVMASLLSAERDSGKAFSNLYPFRESFYERMGYVSFPLTKIARFTTLSLSPLLKMDLAGEIKLQLIGEAYDAYREYLAAMREHRHGMAFFDFGENGRANQNLLWIAMAVFDGKAEGLMLYRILGEEVTKFTFTAFRFYYQTSRARYLMLNWIARHVDQADRVELWLPADEYPETWLADTQVKVESAIRAAMSRVLDVEKLGGMNVGKGSFSARIIDPMCPWNEGFWNFASHEGKLQVSRVSKAECQLTIQGLTTLISGVQDPQDIPLRGWGDTDLANQSIQREMFSRMCPFLHENF